MKEEGMGYTKISRKLNDWGIKTHRDKQWFNKSVTSVLKRKYERSAMVNKLKDQHSQKKSKFIYFF